MRPSLPVALLCLAASLPGLAASPALTWDKAQRAFERNRATIVRVIGPRASGTGVIVGADGHVLTSVRYVGLNEAQVQLGEVAVKAEVVLADAYKGIALLRMTGQTVQAPAVRVDPPLARGEYLVAVRAAGKKGAPTPAITRVERLARREGGPLTVHGTWPAGTALFDGKGQLVAISVGRNRVLPVAVVRAQLQASLLP